MNTKIYSASGREIGQIIIIGDRIKNLAYSIPDYSLESFVMGDGSHKIVKDGVMDEIFTIDRVSKSSNQGIEKITHALKCNSFDRTYYLKLNLFNELKIRWNTKQYYFLTSPFKNDV